MITTAPVRILIWEKYNFNNEKSESAIIYGFEGIEGSNDEASLNGQRNKCICLEFLNNSGGPLFVRDYRHVFF
ncbi:hypothetical protein NXW89_31455 [Bacteroides thetaiotaomicron]|nr:hypothetical protein [Bacteroides thetaiotaomicron]